VVQNLPEAKPKTSLLGVGSTDTPLQGASTSDTPIRAEASKAGTRSSQQPGNAGLSKQGEIPTGTFKWPRSEGSIPTEMARTLKRPRDFKGPGTYKEALPNIKVAIFKDTYPEDKLTEDDQDSILEALGEVLCRTPKGELPHLKS
jgi:hypothetical protein